MKLSKDERLRYEGAKWALDMLRTKSAEEVIKELEWRGINGIPLKLNKSDVNDLVDEIKANRIATMCCMGIAVLHDEFDFGKERLNRYIKRFNEKADCLTRDFTTWQEMTELLKNETGVDFELPEIFREMGDSK